MQTLKIITLVIAAVIISGCTNKSERSSSEQSKESVNKPDTIINSIPINYSAVLDTINPAQKPEIESYNELLELFEKLNYTPESWKAGIREIPRIYLMKIGPKWGTSTANEITVQYKKQIFFRGIAPLILRSNELIMKDRDRLEKIRSSYQANNPLTEMDQIWVRKLAELYKVKTIDDQVEISVLDELWKRVDIVPPSLAMAQGAEESGWGTSRFAAAGNALYGQWTWGKNAIVPEKQRKELGNYGIAAFESLQESICGYMLNLNTHNAYADLRKRRAELRKNGEKISGSILAEQLTKYSERGEEYVTGLKSMMEYNQLSPVDDAYLSNEQPIYLIPTAEK